MTNFVIRTRADSADYKKAACAIEQAAWNDLGFLSFTRAHYEMYAGLLEDYADFQLCLIDQDRGYPVATANCVPVACSSLDDLPPEGWDWLVETAAYGNSRGPVNTLGALAISVPAIYRAKGYARVMIRALIDLAEARGFCGLVAPVRPSAKSRHSRVPIDEYITWTDSHGRPYDPWLRSHLASGGKLVGPCKRSMVVNEPLGFWENWTKSTFKASGEYDVEGGLVPVQIDLEHLQGRYEEPNVWVAYSAGNA